MFSVNSMCYFLVDLEDKNSNLNFHWERQISLKINCSAWRLLLNRVFVACNLTEKGNQLNSILCPFCHVLDESVNNLFFGCFFFGKIWKRFCMWSNLLPSPRVSATSLISSLDSVLVLLSNRKAKFRSYLVYSVIWLIWKPQNSLISKCIKCNPMKMVDEINVLVD